MDARGVTGVPMAYIGDGQVDGSQAVIGYKIGKEKTGATDCQQFIRLPFGQTQPLYPVDQGPIAESHPAHSVRIQTLRRNRLICTQVLLTMMLFKTWMIQKSK